MTVPDRSLDQRQRALQRANVVRAERAQLKKDIKAGKVSAVDVFLDPPDWVCTMKVVNILLAVPRIGRSKANKYMTSCRMSPAKTVEGMTHRQRTELLAIIR